MSAEIFPKSISKYVVQNWVNFLTQLCDSLEYFTLMLFLIYTRHFDSCLKDEPTKDMLKETTGAEDEEPRPKYFRVGIGETQYWTTGELLAMAQDCERTFTNPPMEMSLNLYGEGTLVSAL